MKNKKKSNDRRYFIVSLFIVVLSLAVGYALFAETLNITGTAQATGSFDVEFFSATNVPVGTATGVTNTISGDKNTLTLAASFAKPGDKVTYTVTVRNVGTIDANLLSITPAGDINDPDVTLDDSDLVPGVIAAGASYTFDIVVEWNLASETGKTINYTLALNYQQA